MRLNKNHKDAFVRGVMNDVPVVDYRGQARKLMQDWLVEHMPPPVRAVYNDPELRKYLDSSHRYFHYVAGCFYGQALLEGSRDVPKALENKLRELDGKHEAQFENLAELRYKLNNTIAGCSTLKQALKLMPEFEKYLPTENEATKNLPAVANTVAALIEAGWPKDQTQEK